MASFRSTILAFALLLQVQPLVAEPDARWDNSLVSGAGLPTFEFEVIPFHSDGLFPGAVHAHPYTLDGNARLLIANRAGLLFDGPAEPALGRPTKAANLSKPVAQLLGLDPKKIRIAMMSTLLDREFPARSYLYVFLKLYQPGPARDIVLRFEVGGFDPLQLADPVEVISWHSHGHDGGEMAWGPDDGMLYVSAGDRSSPGDPNNVGQRVDDIFGSILRIDVHSHEPYTVPPDNPFVGMKDVRPEIWSYGLRNPWRFCFHPERKELWVGDNGDESWEMVHRIEKGANAGWSAFEGSHVFRPKNQLGGPTRVHTPAIVQHPHSEMRSVIGGIFYRGNAMPALRDHYLYACYFTKRLWAFSYVDGEVGQPFLVADSIGDVVAIAEGHDWEPILTCHDGRLFKLAARMEIPDSPPWPATLTATGLFTSVKEHDLASGVYPYTTNASAWNDGATKQRFIAVAPGKKIHPLGNLEIRKGWEFPIGSVVGHTLSLGGKPVETQLLYFDGTWRGYTYQWDEDGRDAKLISAGGKDTEIGKQKWRFASRAECMTCHTHRSNFTLALTTRQLDMLTADGVNQLDDFIERGLLLKNKPLETQRNNPVPKPLDPASAKLGTRARTYLDINCAHCHRETGLGGRAGFQLLAHLSLADTGILNAKPTVGLLGRAGARVVAPGDPENSELLGRMNRRGAGQMPLLSSHVIDAQGVALIREWIESLPAEP